MSDGSGGPEVRKSGSPDRAAEPGGALVFGRPLRGWVDALHVVLLVPLVALRPLIWSGDGTGADSLAWQVLVLVGLAVVLGESLSGWRRGWRWGWSGVLAALLTLVLLPAAARSPQGAEGWGLWGMLVVHLGFAAYLMQAVPGRERLALAALLAGVVGECVVALFQPLWVFPAMHTALAAGDPTLVRLDGLHGDLDERLRNGGVYGTFTLANTLAAFLVLVGPACVALAARATGWARWPALAVTGLAVAALALTASKGAWLALAVAAGLAWCLLQRGRGRWLPLVVALPLVALLATRIPAGLAASAQVRIGYWQGAATLISEAPLTGHGLRAFATLSPRALPLAAEPTRYVHDEPLEAAVDAGLPAALLLTALLALLALQRSPAQSAECGVRSATDERTPHCTLLTPHPDVPTVLVALPVFLLTPTCAALGMLDSALGWWPGGASGTGWLAWTLAMGALLAVVTVLARRLPVPPAWAWRLGLGALALHCLIDFDLHSPAIWGTLAVAATLATGASGTARICAVTRPHLTFALLAVLALGAGLGFGMLRSGELLAADALLAALDEARSAVATRSATAGADLAALAADLDLDPPPATHPAQVLAVLTAPLLARVATLAAHWPHSPALDLELAERTPPGAERLARSAALVATQPASAAAHLLYADDLADAGRWDQALDEAAVVLRLSPAALTRRQHIAWLYARAARALPSRATQLDALAAAERAHIAALLTVVNPRNRP